MFFSSICLISNSYADVSLTKLGKVIRLLGPLNEAPDIVVEDFDKGGSLCGKGPSNDLVLHFKEVPNEWISGLVDFKSGSPIRPKELCDVKGSPRGDGAFEIRFSYHQNPKLKRMQFLKFPTLNNLMIDHWWVGAGSSVRTATTSRKKIKQAQSKEARDQTGDNFKNESGYQFNPLAGYATQGTLVDAFEDESQWDRLLGMDAAAFDLNSPELDRFRFVDPKRSNKVERGYVEREPLHLPFFQLPSFERPLVFPLELFNYQAFTRSSLDKKLDAAAKPRELTKADTVIKGMNYVQDLVKEKDYIRAQKALEILTKSAVAPLIPVKNPQWWALKGHLYINLGKTLHEKEFTRQGLDFWRDGVLSLAGQGGVRHTYVEFMAVRLVQNFFDNNLYYLAATILAWSKKYSWSQRTEERFAFDRAEVLYSLGLFDEAKEEFSLFYKQREEKPLNASIDRRLVPAAAFRMGDMAFRQKNYKEAAFQYSKALNNVPTISKFSFEGNWYPEEIALFPHVLFNRAEAFIQLGAYQQALKDLRGFIYVAPQDAKAGLVLFRIGDLLEYLGAPEEKILSAWRECSYRLPETLGARLCEARKSARELIETDNRTKWPRMIGMIEEAIPQDNQSFWADVKKDDLETYVNLVLADAFIKKGEPRQALFRLEKLLKLSPDETLKAWLYEYMYTAFAGSLLKDLKEGRFKEVVASYESRRKELLSNQTRHEVLWSLALAYEKLDLIEQASEVLAQGERVKAVIAREKLRPFEEPAENWATFRARLNIKLFRERKVTAQIVEESLRKTSDDLVEALRLKAEYASLQGKHAEAAEGWKKIAARDHLTFDEVKLYSNELMKINNGKERAELLEKNVGVWLTEKNKAGVDNMPPADLLVDLAELRAAQSSQWLGALSIYDYLLTIEASKLGSVVNQAMINFRRGELQKSMGKNDDARQSFEQAKRLDPDGIWGRLASSALKELARVQAAQTPNK